MVGYRALTPFALVRPQPLDLPAGPRDHAHPASRAIYRRHAMYVGTGVVFLAIVVIVLILLFRR